MAVDPIAEAAAAAAAAQITPGMPDPTANVLSLVAAAIQRQDDLREVTAGYQEKLIEQNAQHLADLSAIRAEFGKQLREAETNRIDAIRAVDVGAVSRAAEVSATQATTLAAQVATSAETLRGQVQAAATASTIALAAALEPIQKSIDDLRRVQYEQQGQRTAQTETKTGNQWAITAAISIVGLLFVIMAFVVGLLITP